MRIVAAALLCAAVVATGAVLVSGGSDADPRTPAALPGLPPPFLGTTVSGDGGITAAVDAYGDVVDLRAPGPAGAPLIDNSSARQAAGTVPADTGIVPRVRIGDGDGGGDEALPMWRAEAVTQRYLPGTNVVRTVARFASARVVITTASASESLAMTVRSEPASRSGAGSPSASRLPTGEQIVPSVSIDVEGGVRCAAERRAAQLDLNCRSGRVVPPVHGAAARGAVIEADARVIRAATAEGRDWLAGSRRLGAASGADRRPPRWATAMYERSLLAIHALTSARTGAVAAGARDGWAYVWPRDAATAALALQASGHGGDARKVAKFLTGLDLNAAARFAESGSPVPGRGAQGDAAGWVTAATRATHLPPPTAPFPWRNRADYQESSPGDYLGNALAAGVPPARVLREFGSTAGLFRTAGDPGSGLDSAAAWAIRPFERHPLYPTAERTLLQLLESASPYGITPGEGWQGGEDPWTAPTASSAWALAGLPSPRARHASLVLLEDLRRASTPAGDLPERVGAHTGIPTSTTPLLWSSAFTVLALHELWP